MGVRIFTNCKYTYCGLKSLLAELIKSDYSSQLGKRVKESRIVVIDAERKDYSALYKRAAGAGGDSSDKLIIVINRTHHDHILLNEHTVVVSKCSSLNSIRDLIFNFLLTRRVALNPISFSTREDKVLREWVTGKSTLKIAESTDAKIKSVNNSKYRILRKCNIKDISSMLLIASLIYN